ncbi:DNA methyltransferase, partial [Planococcus glaciei]|uniref:DNA methyltransferase n=1 Tax=Planococcus glaciei TaxID=459472 RepID=UPI00069DA834
MELTENTTSLKEVNKEIQLSMKKYIQPFEKILAIEELKVLTNNEKYVPSFHVEIDNSEVFISMNSSVSHLQDKLAYWDKIGVDNHFYPTLQVVYEMSTNQLLDIDEQALSNETYTNYPKTRKLRYGVHDLHEYRGKFFPQLVRSLINISGIPHGSLVLDPFGGSGTTGVEANVLGMNSIAMDLNPLSVRISEVKTRILKVDADLLYQEVLSLIERLKEPENNPVTEQWDEKDNTYLERWFDPTALQEVSNVIGSINNCKDEDVKSFFEVCLSNIIRSVSWQKESDLRVRKEIVEYVEGTVYKSFINEVKRQVDRIIPYLEIVKYKSQLGQTEIREGNTIDICEVFDREKGKCDVLITSPPYATALPYLDTDRLSLIVLGLLPREEHKKRDMNMIGNREISEKQRVELWNEYLKRKEELPENVKDFLDELAISNHEESIGFRRKNLPALLAKYFLDMSDSMKSSLQMMKPGSYGFYVVGTNSTNVENNKKIIPTDMFLWEIGAKVGWEQVNIINMEMLQSRDIFKKNSGSAESILIFKSPLTKQLERKAIYSSEDLSEFRISGAEWNFNDENVQSELHSIHPYPAKFIPQIPRKAILEWTNKGDVVLDPFCGSGTTLLESILHGRRAIGVDNNSVACLVSEAKIADYTKADIMELNNFLLYIEQLDIKGWDEVEAIIPQYKNLEYWFSDLAIIELGKLNGLIEKLHGNSKVLSQAIFSSIIVRVSYQDSDTRYARKEYEYVKGKAHDYFKKKLRKVIKNLETIVNVSKESAVVYQIDGRNLKNIKDEEVNMIVTSPPYLNAYDYHKYHRHRIHWIDGDVELARDKEIGKHDTFTRPNANADLYFEDMTKCFIEWKRVLKTKGKLLIVIGDAIV